MRRFMPLLVALLILIPASLACETVVDGMTVAAAGELPLDLCKGTYNLTKGITIAGNSTIVDCKESVFLATDRSAAGFIFAGQSGEIRGCDLRGFGVALRIESGTAKARRTIVRDGAVGIQVLGGRLIDSPDLTLRNLSLDRANASVDISKYLPVANTSSAQLPPVSVTPTNVSTAKPAAEKPIVSSAGAAAATTSPLPIDVERMLIYIKGFVIAIVTIGFAVFLVWEVKRGVGAVFNRVRRR